MIEVDSFSVDLAHILYVLGRKFEWGLIKCIKGCQVSLTSGINFIKNVFKATFYAFIADSSNGKRRKM